MILRVPELDRDFVDPLLILPTAVRKKKAKAASESEK
jgi:hypothetical protein